MHTHLRGSQILEKSLKHSSNPKVRPWGISGTWQCSRIKGLIEIISSALNRNTFFFSPGQRVMQKPAKCQDENDENVPFFFLNLMPPYICWPLIFNLIESVTKFLLQKNNQNNQQFAEPFNKHLNFEELGFAFPSSGFSRWKCYRFRQASKGQYSKTTRQRDLLSESMARWEWPMGRWLVSSIFWEKRNKKLLSNFTAWLKRDVFLSL